MASSDHGCLKPPSRQPQLGGHQQQRLSPLKRDTPRSRWVQRLERTEGAALTCLCPYPKHPPVLSLTFSPSLQPDTSADNSSERLYLNCGTLSQPLFCCPHKPISCLMLQLQPESQHVLAHSPHTEAIQHHKNKGPEIARSGHAQLLEYVTLCKSQEISKSKERKPTQKKRFLPWRAEGIFNCS